MAERLTRNEQVVSSILTIGSSKRRDLDGRAFCFCAGGGAIMPHIVQLMHDKRQVAPEALVLPREL